MSATDLVMYRGDDRSFLLTITGFDDVTGATVRFTAKRRLTDADADAVIALVTPSDVEIVDATHVRVNIPKAATADLDRDTRLVWDVQVTLAGETRTLPDPDLGRATLGSLVIRRDVTRAAP